MRDTATIDLLTKKHPEDGVVAANDKFVSSEVNTCCKKEAPDEPLKEESKSGGTRNDTEIISVLFILRLC